MKKKEKMSAGYVYFVLYIVVIAELMVVIHERDLLIENLEVDALLVNIIKPPQLVTFSDSVKYRVAFNSAAPSYFNFFCQELLSDQERDNVVFNYKIRPDSRVQEGDVNISAERNRNIGNLTLRATVTGQDPLPQGIVQSIVSGTPVLLKLEVVAKVPRILPEEYVKLKTVKEVINRFLKAESEKDTVIISALNNYLSVDRNNSAEIDKQCKRFAAQVFLGLSPDLLYELLSEGDEIFFFGADKGSIESRLNATKVVLEKLGYFDDAAKKLNNVQINKTLEEFQKGIISLYKNKSEFGFDDSDSFYFISSNVKNYNIRLELY